MKIKLILMAVFAIAFTACNDAESDDAEEVLSYDIENSVVDKVSYSLGVNIGITLKQQGLTDINHDAMKAAFDDVFAGRNLAISQRDAGDNISSRLEELAGSNQGGNTAAVDPNAVAGADGSEEGAAFLAKNATRSEVIQTASGLQYEVMKEGDGNSPTASDQVTVHYHGTFLDGSVFDSSVERGEPATFPLGGVIPGWTEGVQLMKTGGKTKFFIPGNLAYGARGFGDKIPPNTTLIFEVELISIN